ncbi:MAG: hypothetical protein RBT20_06655 [Syntrophales bacterium]|jgi:hypothetical protein|nr:hypothetical protein [Syntrophales bacterium]
MKNVFSGVLVVLFVLVSAGLGMADTAKGKMKLKVGQEVYVCNCGEKCPCNTMSRNLGNCTNGGRISFFEEAMNATFEDIDELLR